MISRTTSWSSNDSPGNSSQGSTTGPSRAKSIEIEVSKDVCSVAFLADGQHVVGGGYGGKLRVWQTEEGEEVGAAMNAGSTTILNIAASNDGKWVFVGTANGQVLVWDAELRQKVDEFQAHDNWVRAVDVSPDMTRIASGSDDKTVCVWSIASGGQRLFSPLEHDNVLASVKFSPDGELLATATWWKESIRIYNGWNGYLLLDIPIRVNSYANQSLAWIPNSAFLLALSSDGDIKCFDLSKGILPFHWHVYTGGSNATKCMAVSSNGKFVAVSANSLVFFWDTVTQKQIKPVIAHAGAIHSMAISPDFDLVTGGGKTITVRSLSGLLPSQYVKDVSRIKETESPVPESRAAVAANDDVGRLNTLVNSMASMGLQDFPLNKTPNFYNNDFPNDLTTNVRRDGHDPVASGGFADIYRGMLQTSWEPIRVAIKAIRTYSADDGNFFKKQKRLRREIKVWLALKHTNVLPLLGTATGFGRFPAMVCPWVENGSLSSFLENYYNKISVIDILTLLNDTASGLQYLHSCSVVHGDLSGSNVLVCKNKRAYISDFGLSTLLTELGGPTFATSVHERGTLRWTAPELLDLQMCEDDADPTNVVPTKHSDVYSFGGVMLQILTGKVPYHYYSREAQVVHAVSRGMTPRRPNSTLVTERRWTLIQWCWSTADPSQSRPSSDDIVQFTDDELTKALTP